MDEEQICRLEEERYAAMLAGDAATLERLFDDALTYTHSNGAVDTKASYIAGLRDKVWQYKTISRENERVVIRGATALVFCRLKIDLDVRGTPRKVDSNSLAVWAKDAAEWRLVALHSAGVPA